MRKKRLEIFGNNLNGVQVGEVNAENKIWKILSTSFVTSAPKIVCPSCL